MGEHPTDSTGIGCGYAPKKLYSKIGMAGPNLGVALGALRSGSPRAQYHLQEETDRTAEPTDSSCRPGPPPLGGTGFSV